MLLLELYFYFFGFQSNLIMCLFFSISKLDSFIFKNTVRFWMIYFLLELIHFCFSSCDISVQWEIGIFSQWKRVFWLGPKTVVCSRVHPPFWPLSPTLGCSPTRPGGPSQPFSLSLWLSHWKKPSAQWPQRQAQLPGFPSPDPGPLAWKLPSVFKHFQKHSVQAFW